MKITTNDSQPVSTAQRLIRRSAADEFADFASTDPADVVLLGTIYSLFHLCAKHPDAIRATRQALLKSSLRDAFIHLERAKLERSLV